MNGKAMKNQPVILLAKIATFLLCVSLSGCDRTATKKEKEKEKDEERYFASPLEAVEQITLMLNEKNWSELAKYYDLADSPEERAELVSGKFFFTEEKPEAAHPGGFWKYKHPFAPAFEFESTREQEEAGVIEVTVGVEIDQGGGPKQRGLQTFLMRKSDKGYQVMPQKEPAR